MPIISKKQENNLEKDDITHLIKDLWNYNFRKLKKSHKNIES